MLRHIFKMEQLETSRIFVEHFNRILSCLCCPIHIQLHGYQAGIHFFHENIVVWNQSVFCWFKLEVVVVITKLDSHFFHHSTHLVPVGNHFLVHFNIAVFFFDPRLNAIFYAQCCMIIGHFFRTFQRNSLCFNTRVAADYFHSKVVHHFFDVGWCKTIKFTIGITRHFQVFVTHIRQFLQCSGNIFSHLIANCVEL